MKEKKNVFVIIGISLLVIGITFLCLFFVFNKNEKVKPPKKDSKEEVEVKEEYDEFGNKILTVYETKEEVYDVITKNYLGKGETIVSTREENGCWYYKSSNDKDEYSYCIDDPIIRVTTTEIIKIN